MGNSRSTGQLVHTAEVGSPMLQKSFHVQSSVYNSLLGSMHLDLEVQRPECALSSDGRLISVLLREQLSSLHTRRIGRRHRVRCVAC
jgi:hypothetical protein